MSAKFRFDCSISSRSYGAKNAYNSPRSGRRRKKRSQNNVLESHVWSQISGKPVEKKNLKFFESRLEFLHFDMLENEGRGSNRLGVKKSFVTQIVRYRSKTIKLKNVVFELNY